MRNLVVMMLLLVSVNTMALDRRPYEMISMQEILTDTQKQLKTGDDWHVSIVWWVPYEYWAAAFSKDQNLAPTMRKQMLRLLQDYTIIAVVQADVTPLGAFQFYPRREVLKSMHVSYTDEQGKTVRLTPEQKLSGDMDIMMRQMTPVLEAAMGNMGANLNFIVYSDMTPGGSRLIDPYERGQLKVSLESRAKKAMDAVFEMPLNALYEPRYCPNGKQAHISWNFCPWSGKRL